MSGRSRHDLRRIRIVLAAMGRCSPANNAAAMVAGFLLCKHLASARRHKAASRLMLASGSSAGGSPSLGLLAATTRVGSLVKVNDDDFGAFVGAAVGERAASRRGELLVSLRAPRSRLK